MTGLFSSFTITSRSPDGVAELPALDLKMDLKKERDKGVELQRELDVLLMARVEDNDDSESKGEGSAESSSCFNRISTNANSDDNDNNNPDEKRNELEFGQLLDTRRELAAMKNRFPKRERGRNEMEDCVSCAKTIIDDCYVEDDEDDTFNLEVGEATGEGMGEAKYVKDGDDERVLLLMKEKRQLAKELKVMKDTMTESTRSLPENKIQLTEEIAALRSHFEMKIKRLTDDNEMMMDELDMLQNTFDNDRTTALATTKENEQLKAELKLLHEELSLINLTSVPSSSVIEQDGMERVKFLRCDIYSIIKKKEELEHQMVSLHTDNDQLQDRLLSMEKERDEMSAAEKRGWLSLNACKRELSCVQQQLKRTYKERDAMKQQKTLLKSELVSVRRELQQTRKHHIKNNKMVMSLISDMKKSWW